MARERMETVESEAPASKRARGLEPDRSATRPGDPLLARARSLLSLQQSAGNRAVSRLVQRWRDGSKDVGLPKGMPVPVQRQGPEEEEEPLQGRFESVQQRKEAVAGAVRAQCRDRRRKRSRCRGGSSRCSCRDRRKRRSRCRGGSSRCSSREWRREELQLKADPIGAGPARA